MRTYREIYEELTAQGPDRFTLRKLIDIYQKESSWVGTPHQLLRLKSVSHEITGIRPGECSACNMEVLRNLGRWLHHHEKGILNDLQPAEKPKKVKA